MCKHQINRVLSYKGLSPVCVMSHEPHASLSSEVVEADICVIHTKRVEQIEDRLSHHRRTAALALRLGTIRDHVAHMISRLALRFPHRVHYVSARRGPHVIGYLCALSHEKTTHGLLHRTKQQQPSETCGNRVG